MCRQKVSKARVNCMTAKYDVYVMHDRRMRGCRAGRRKVGRFHQGRNYHMHTRSMSKSDDVSSAELDNAAVTMASLHYVTIFQAVSSCCIVAI